MIGTNIRELRKSEKAKKIKGIHYMECPKNVSLFDTSARGVATSDK